ncbi:hypothetical protein [Enterobacter kobei]|uniref:hypothetical protein n=1 Tax=Enterobacter kobei TaxID=208224 RepID=UPI0007996F1E|nr:hypothetical protein [Enterobacter kobei]SAF46868.1 Uncharacterised protein [Enterobacter kobei]
MKAKKICAYCKSTSDLTNEHIFPSAIIKSFDIELLSINDKSDYHFKSDPVIGDVCAKCNNGPLSQLDAHFVTSFKDQMIKPLNPGDEITFEYDYDLLLRELLKISYNSARASNGGYNARATLEKYTPYILNGNKKFNGVLLSLLIVTSANRINLETGEPVEPLEPYLLRSTSIDGLNLNTNNYITRMVAFNSFWFFLLIPKSSVPSKIKSEFWKEFKSKTHLHGVLLKERETSVMITKDKTTYLHPDLMEKMYRKSR